MHHNNLKMISLVYFIHTHIKRKIHRKISKYVKMGSVGKKIINQLKKIKLV